MSNQAKVLVLWRGFHSPKILFWLDQAWNNQCQLIIVPPSLNDFTFLKLWTGKIQFEGQWSQLPTLPKVEVQNGVVDAWPQDTVLGLFTSGTVSGYPRLALFSKANLLCSLESIRSLFEVGQIKKIFCYPQPTHIFGFVLGYLQSYLYKIPLIAPEGPYSREGHKLWQSSVDINTMTLGTPTHFIDLITWLSTKENKVSTDSNGSVTDICASAVPKSYSCIVGGAPVSITLWKRIKTELNIQFPSIGYGATEASLGISHSQPGVEPFCDSLVGSILPHVEICKAGEEGFTFRGPNVACRILDKDKFIKPDQIHLNDIIKPVKHQNQLSYIFEGRSDLIINRGGLKISPELIESEIENQLACKAIVVGIPNLRLGEDIGILLEQVQEKAQEQAQEQAQAQETAQKPEQSKLIPHLDLAQIQAILVDKFQLRINPELVVMDVLPKTDNGKKNRLEATKKLLKKIHRLGDPLPVFMLKNFMPHRSSAVWIDQLIEFRPKFGWSEVEVKSNSSFIGIGDSTSNAKISASAAVEWVAQTYGYSRIANDIFELEKIPNASKTLIAEVKSLENLCEDEWQQIQIGEKIQVKVNCTHNFAPLFIIAGEVFRNTKLIAKINLKVYAGH